MMTSAQSCLITSFFKSPPKDEESRDTCTKTSDVGDAGPDVTQAGHSDSVQSGQRFVEDCRSDLSDDGLSSGSEEEEEKCGGKPLVVNLCGLLSPAMMNGPKAVQLALRQSNNNKIIGSTKRTGTESESDRHKLQPDDRTDVSAEQNVKSNGLNAEQENCLRNEGEDCIIDSSQESSDALVGKATCIPSDAHPGSAANKSSSQMKQCVLSWNSRSGTLDLSVPAEPPRLPNLEELKEGGESREERGEESVVVSEEGAGEIDTAADVEGREVSSASRRKRKKRRDSKGETDLEAGSKLGSDGCEGGECLQGELETLVCLPRQRTAGEETPGDDVVAGSEEGGLGGDDSFEDFVESVKRRRSRLKRKHSKCEGPEEGVVDANATPCQLPTNHSSADSSRDREPKTDKRPRRSAAVSASARISLGRTSRRRSSGNPAGERVSRTEVTTVDCQQDSIPVAEPDPQNVTHHSCVILDSDCNLESVSHNQDVNPTPVCITLDSDHGNEPQMLELEDEECKVDSSVILVSSTPPTTSPIKHSSPVQPAGTEPAVTPAETEPAVTSAGLSAAWAKIFSRPNKPQPSEVVSSTKENTTVALPVKTAKRKRTPSNSPRRHGSLSPSRSPRKCRSPRRGSPLRVRSPRKGSLLHSSPLREARGPHPASRRLPFSGNGGRGGGGGEVDSAPFEGVVHVQQIDPSCGLWKLGPPKLLPVVRSRRDNIRPKPQMPIAEELGLSTSRTSAGLNDSKVSPHIQLCSKEETDRILKQLEEAHPERDVRTIFARYARIATPLSSDPCDASTATTTEGKLSAKSKSDKRVNPRRNNLSLKCSIKICHGAPNAKDSKITVDTAAYQKKGRRSLRLAKKTQEPTSENASNPGPHTRAGEVKNGSQVTEPRPAASMNTAIRPPAFALEPWTEVYRPRRSAEVIGNGPQVGQLRAWLRAWETRCRGPRESEQTKLPRKDPSKRCDETKTSKASEKGHKGGPSDRESGIRQESAVPWWVSEKDSDFLSISHLRRRRCHAPKCLDSSESGGETGGEEEEEDDDDSLCPVTLLCGPHGSGKSAAVYVCAQELGFKVFEVNSSGVRSRQTIMSTLREATLSHQVVMATQSSKPAQVTGGIASYFGKCKSHASKEIKTSKASNPPPNSGGLYSFFKPEKEVKGQRDGKPAMSAGSQRDTSQKKKGSGASSSGELQTKKKKRRRSQRNSTITIDDTPDDVSRPPVTTEHAQSNSSVALATATVILLDEVDILFDEDKGFWSAVYELIATTKRPIIMTCNDARYDLECDHQKLLFSRPPTPELSLHMQLLCLSHGAHMTSEAANQIAAFLKGDIRKVMNCLQFWLSLLPSNKSNDVILERQQLESTPAVGTVASEGQSTRRKEDLLLSLEHLLGFSAGKRQLLKWLQQPQSHSIDPALLGGVLETLHRNGLVVAHPLDQLQPGPAGERLARAPSHPTSVDATHTASGDADTCSDLTGTGTGPSCSRTQPAVDRTEDSTAVSAQETEMMERDEQSLADECVFSAPWRCCRNSKKTTSKNPYLDSLSNFSDTLSLVDTIAVRSRDSHMTQLSDAWWKCELETGLLDELPLGGCGDCCWRAEVTRTSDEMVSVAEGLAMGECRRGMREAGGCEDLYGLASREKNQRRVEVVQSSLRECSSVFGSHWELSRAAMATDGLPMLQLICHSESLREAAHVKRRFRHYLQASVVDLCHLKALPRTAAFLSAPHPAEPP